MRTDGSRERTWYHTIDLPDGGCTPGWYDTREAPRHVEWPAAVRGGRCLDVGTFDGFWAFELERRGASEVVALDVDDPARLDWSFDDEITGPELVRTWNSERGPGFNEAAGLLGSRVERVNCSVYDIDPAQLGEFDVVLCGALLLHLRDPIAALERMRTVCRGELLLVEHLDPALELVARRIPAARFAPDWDQWWRANSTGLVQMVGAAGFDVVWLGRRFVVPYGPGAPRYRRRASLAHSLAAGSRTPGLLFRALRARPRERRPRRT